MAVDVALFTDTLNAARVRAVQDLREVIAEMVEKSDRETVLAQLEEARVQLRKGGHEDAEELLLEVMDFVTGWCSRQMRI